jgi:probable HAF family extracellular repeat protein
MHRSLLSAVLSLCVLFSPLVAAHAASYTFITFDVPSGTIVDANGINTAGQIVGHFVDTTNHIHGFLIDGATFTTIDVPGAPRTEATGINEMGQIVGGFIDVTGNGHAFLKDGASFTTFDFPGTFGRTWAWGINTAGQIVGVVGDASGNGHGFLKDGTTFTTIDVPGATITHARGINTAGQIVGHFSDATGLHGFLKDGATFTTIDVPGARLTFASGINTAGQIAGGFDDATGRHGFLKDGATFTTIDIPGARGTNAFGINETGQIVGTFADATGYPHGFVATPDEGDRTPPVITVSASPATLWPPDGRLVTVTVSGTMTDESGGSGVQANSAAYQVMDEYGQVQPSGSVPLVDGTYTFTVALQASRRGNDPDGRHYMIVVSARDHAGNSGAASATVTVPRN